MTKDYYEILGVARDADTKQIRSAFRKLARKYHPDVNPNNAEATEKFKEINEAHEVLSDPDKRAKYDQYGARWKEYDAWEKAGRPGRSPFAEAGGPQPHVEYRTVDIENYEDLFGTADPFSDFFHDMFGDSVRARGRQSARSARPASRRGEDVEAETTITLEEAYSGTTRTVQLEGPGGTRRVEVRIPPGIRDGARVRAAGQGAEGAGEGGRGDLFIRVHILPHATFTRDGDDLRVRIAVPLDVALLGGEVPVPTLSGSPVTLKVPPNTQNGTRLRLRGLGMPRLKGEGNGDLYAEVDVRLPVPLSEEQRKVIEQLRTQKETTNA